MINNKSLLSYYYEVATTELCICMKPSHQLEWWSFRVVQPSRLARKIIEQNRIVPSLMGWQNWGTEKWLDLSACSRVNLESGSSEPRLGNYKTNFLEVSLIQMRARSKSVHSWRGDGIDKTPPHDRGSPGRWLVPREVTGTRTSRRDVVDESGSGRSKKLRSWQGIPVQIPPISNLKI